MNRPPRSVRKVAARDNTLIIEDGAAREDLVGTRNPPITHTDASKELNEGWVDVLAAPTAR